MSPRRSIDGPICKANARFPDDRAPYCACPVAALCAKKYAKRIPTYPKKEKERA